MRILLMSTGRRVSLIQSLRKTACEMKLDLYIARLRFILGRLPTIL